jgi:uncharacterized protein
MPNPFCHLELATDDPERAKAFYGSLFSWEFHDHEMGEGTYTMFQPGAGPDGGIYKRQGDQPPGWTAYVQVDSLDESLARVEPLGGKVLVGRTEVPSHGWFGVIQDPTGCVIALWESLPGG